MEYLTITELGLGHLTWDEVSPWCSLDSLKRHLIVEHDVDDELIQEYAVASWNLVEVTIERSLKELFEQYDGIMPPTLIHAVRLLVGRYYAEREGESFTNRRDMSFSISALLMPYKGIPKVKPTVEDVPEPAPQPEPELEYTEEEKLRYGAVAELLGCRICDLTEAERTFLVSAEWAEEVSHSASYSYPISRYFEQIREIVQTYYSQYEKEIYDNLAKRTSVVFRKSPTEYKALDITTGKMKLYYEDLESTEVGNAKQASIENTIIVTGQALNFLRFEDEHKHFAVEFGADYEKTILTPLNKLEAKLNGSDAQKVRDVIERYINPLRRYFEALCKLEYKLLDIVDVSTESPYLIYFVKHSDIYSTLSFIHQLIFEYTGLSKYV